MDREKIDAVCSGLGSAAGSFLPHEELSMGGEKNTPLDHMGYTA